MSALSRAVAASPGCLVFWLRWALPAMLLQPLAIAGLRLRAAPAAVRWVQAAIAGLGQLGLLLGCILLLRLLARLYRCGDHLDPGRCRALALTLCLPVWLAAALYGWLPPPGPAATSPLPAMLPRVALAALPACGPLLLWRSLAALPRPQRDRLVLMAGAGLAVGMVAQQLCVPRLLLAIWGG